MIGVIGDSQGDLDAFDAGYEFLKGKGAKRFFFVGNRYTDLDEWIARRRDTARGGRSYGDQDFLSDVTSWLAGSTDVSNRGPVFGFGEEEAQERVKEQQDLADLDKVKARFVRAPERASLAYRDPSVEKKIVDMAGDALCCIVHDKNDLNREDLLNATVFVHGNEPEPKVVQIGPRFFVAPGKLAGAAEQTCGLIELVNRQLQFTAWRLDGKVLLDARPLHAVASKTKLSVK